MLPDAPQLQPQHNPKPRPKTWLKQPYHASTETELGSRRTDAETDGDTLRAWFSRRGLSSAQSVYTSRSSASGGSRFGLGIRKLDSLHHHRTHSYYAKWFKFPKAIHVWDQEQHPHMTHWADLFFDLIYVVVAFKSGNLLSIRNGDGSYALNVPAFGLFVCVLLILYGGWESRLHLRSRLRLTDKFHRAVLIFKGLTVAYATHSLPNKDVLNGQTYAAQFSATMLVHSAINVYLWVESYALAKEQKTKKNSLRFAWIYTIGLACIAASLACSLMENVDFVVVYVLWGASYIIPKAVKDILALTGVSNRSNSIPVHYAYVIQRQGEWTMLVLGEGILQIIISPATDSVSYFAVFVLSYLVLALLQLLHYSVLPFNIEHHVIHQSTTRYTVLENVQVLYSIALVVVGVSLKLGLKAKSLNQEPLLCVSISITVFMLFLKHLLHLGITRELGSISFSRNKRASSSSNAGLLSCSCNPGLVLVREKGIERSSVWIGKFGLPLVFLIFPTFKLSVVFVNLLVFLWLVVIIAFQAFTGAFKRQRRVRAAFAIIKAVIKFKRLLANKRKREAAERLKAHMDPQAEKYVRFIQVQPQPLSKRKEPGRTKKKLEVEEPPETGRNADEEERNIEALTDEAGEDIESSVEEAKGSSSTEDGEIDRGGENGDVSHEEEKEEEEEVVTARRSTSSMSRASKSGLRPAMSEKLSKWHRFGRRLSEVARGLNLYERPKNSLDWNELDRSHETVWGNLFFDLIYVGVLFQLGRILTQDT